MLTTPSNPGLELLGKMGTPTRLGMTIGKEYMGRPYVPYDWTLYAERRILAAIADPGKRFVILNVPPQTGKLGPNTLPVPTPDGWTTMGELEIGDRVFGRDGMPTSVVHIAEHSDKPMRRVRFTDGTSLDAGADHLWHARDRGREVFRTPRTYWEGTVSTEQMAEQIELSDGHKRWAVPIAEPLQLPDVSFAIDPWLLGYWLGNGSTRDRYGVLTTHALDLDYVSARCGVAGWSPTLSRENVGRGSGTVRLGREFGDQLGPTLADKRIPVAYLRASERQRRDLLAGLVDSDGYTRDRSGQIELTFTHELLAMDSVELLRTLGEKVRVKASEAAYRVDGVRRVTGTRWRISWTPRECPAQSPRKIAMWTPAATTKGDRLEWRYVESIEEMPTVPSRCIQVDAPDSLYVSGSDFIVSHNSSFMMLLCAWYLGMFPHNQIIGVGYNEDYMATWGLKVRNLLQRYGHDFFGETVSSQQDAKSNWKMSNGFGGMMCAGILSGVTGNPGNLIWIDDVIKTMEDASSTLAKQKHFDEYEGSITTRFHEDTTVIMTVTRWVEDDLSGRLQERQDDPAYDGDRFEVITFPAFAEAPEDLTDEEREAYRDVIGRKHGDHLVSTHSRASYESQQKSLRGGAVWLALYQQDPGTREGGMFPKSKWKFYDVNDPTRPRIVRAVRAWDLATTEGDGDYTVGTKMGVATNGDLYLLDVQRVRKAPGDVEKLVKDTARGDGAMVKILIEQERSGAGGTVVDNYKRALRGFHVEGIPAKGSKEERATPHAYMQNDGRSWLPLHLPEVCKVWIDEHKKMMGDGRRPRHDDQIDTGAYCANDLLSDQGSDLFIPGMDELPGGEGEALTMGAMNLVVMGGNPFVGR